MASKACVARMVDSMFESGVKRSAGAVVGKGRAKGKMAEDGEGDEDGDGLGIQVKAEVLRRKLIFISTLSTAAATCSHKIPFIWGNGNGQTRKIP